MDHTSDIRIAVDGISKAFPEGGVRRRESVPIRAVEDVSVLVRRGRTLGIVGESGCGKSTLARLMVGLIPYDRGAIYMDGQQVDPRVRKAARALRSKVQLVLQDAKGALDPRMTIGQLLEEALVVHSKSAPKRRAQPISDILSKVGLSSSHLPRYPRELSGGQRQRVNIARSLLADPHTLILDEPTSALDVSVQAQILNLLLELQQDIGLSYVFISHDLSVVRHVADSVAVMYLGSVIEYASTESLFGRPQHPYTVGLMETAGLRPDAVVNIPFRVSGNVPSPADKPQGCTFHPRCPASAYLSEVAGDGTEVSGDGGAKIGIRCFTEEPKLSVDALPSHASACHYRQYISIVSKD